MRAPYAFVAAPARLAGGLYTGDEPTPVWVRNRGQFQHSDSSDREMTHLVTAVLIWLIVAGASAPATGAPGAKVPVPARTAQRVPPLPMPNPRRDATKIETVTAAGNTAPTSLKTDDAEATRAPAQETEAKPLTPEAQHNHQLDAAIAPVLGTALSQEDAQRLREALRAVSAGDPAKARALRAQMGDPAARKLVEWYVLRNGFGEPADFMAFSNANPDWPDRQLMRRRAEEQLLAIGGSSQKIRAFFGGGEPQTGAGLAALASAYLAEKDEARAKALAATVWREHELASTFETGFLERFKGLLSEADHKRRLDRILVDSVRFSAERSERATIARRVIPLLSPDERKKAEARLAVFLQSKAAAKLLAALPAEDENAPDWGLAYQRVQHLRGLGKMDEVWKILQGAPTDPDKVISPDDWWTERRAAAYAALRSDKPDIAYAVVRDPGPLTVNPLKDASFMAGWLALRRLGDAKAAVSHFEVSRKAADGPLTLARADYWLGRALEAQDRRADADKHYAAAARLFDTFHGQLARHKLAANAPELTASLPTLPSTDESARFNALDAVKAAVVTDKLDLDSSITRALLGQLRYSLKTEGELALLAHLALRIGDTQMSVRIGKTAIARGMNLVSYAYPVHALPAYKALRESPEKAMLLGIARQESEFNSAIVSTAGARGLLQVMPITARHVCRDYKVKCDIPKLLTDNSYNAMIASAYIGDRMAEFSGNYVLTLAGYNAGPGRAREWIRAFGDPRDPKTDPIDWIETIPFEETREYVKKVLSNIQVYRARLGETNALRLADDLKLGVKTVR
jgi:soluble lytic murein transglycosylase